MNQIIHMRNHPREPEFDYIMPIYIDPMYLQLTLGLFFADDFILINTTQMEYANLLPFCHNRYRGMKEVVG